MDLTQLKGSDLFKVPQKGSLSLTIGQRLVAKVIEVGENRVILDILGRLVTAKPPSQVTSGEQLLLVYQGKEGSSLIFKDISRGQVVGQEQATSGEILSNLGLTPSERRESILQSLFHFKLPISLENVQKVDNLLGNVAPDGLQAKLEQILGLVKAGTWPQSSNTKDVAVSPDNRILELFKLFLPLIAGDQNTISSLLTAKETAGDNSLLNLFRLLIPEEGKSPSNSVNSKFEASKNSEQIAQGGRGEQSVPTRISHPIITISQLMREVLAQSNTQLTDSGEPSESQERGLVSLIQHGMGELIATNARQEVTPGQLFMAFPWFQDGKDYLVQLTVEEQTTSKNGAAQGYTGQLCVDSEKLGKVIIDFSLYESRLNLGFAVAESVSELFQKEVSSVQTSLQNLGFSTTIGVKALLAKELADKWRALQLIGAKRCQTKLKGIDLQA